MNTLVDIDPDRQGGKPVLRGTRFTIEQYIAELYEHGAYVVDARFDFTEEQTKDALAWVIQIINEHRGGG